MKEKQGYEQNLVRGIERWKDDDELFMAVLGVIPDKEELEPNGLWEAGYIQGGDDRSDIVRIRIYNLFRRDYERIPDRIEEISPSPSPQADHD